MTTAYTTLLGLALPVQGELQGTWGDEVNNYITNYLDAAVAGTQTISGSQTAVTLSKTTGSSLSQAGSGATGSSQYFVINCTGNPAGTLTITAPAASKAYLIINATSTSQDVKIVGAGPTTGVTLVSGERAIVSWNGSDFVKVANFGGVGSFTTISATTGNITTVNATTVDTTNLEVTNIKAKDGTASMTLADATGVASFSANPVFSGGTANGVLYLNGSKVATSGTALAFNGTSLLVGKNSSDANNWGVQNYATNAFGSGMQLTYGGVGSAGLWVPAASSLAFGADAGSGTTELMRLTSTGLGIGTSSPTQKLEVAGSVLLNPTNPALAFNTLAYQVYKQGTSLRLYANSIDHLVCDGTGNVGIGTSSPTNRLTVAAPNAKQNVVSTTGTNEVVLFLQNTGGDFYIGRENSAGTYFSAPAYSTNLFSAGAYPMLFWTNSTERMRLDSSGNLGLGVTPSAWVSTSRALQILPYASVSCQTNGAANFGFNFYESSGNTFSYTTTDQAGRFSALTDGSFAWFNAPSGTAGNAITFTQAMTLDASGNLGIGTTSPQRALHVNGSTGAFRLQGTSVGGYIEIVGPTTTNFIGTPAAISSGSTTDFGFYLNGLERARITSGGDFLVGTTSAGGNGATIYSTGVIASVWSSSSSWSLKNSEATSGTSCIDLHRAVTTGDPTFQYFGTEATFTTRGSISYNRAGGLVAYNTTSDYRAKDIIGPVQNPGATIDALKVYEGKMKGATQSRPMLVAHEAQEHAPYAVSGVKDEVNEDGTPKFQQMDVSSLVPLLLAEIQSLRARVAALEKP